MDLGIPSHYMQQSHVWFVWSCLYVIKVLNIKDRDLVSLDYQPVIGGRKLALKRSKSF